MHQIGMSAGYGVAEDLILSVMTERNTSIVDRIQAAGIAGFQGIGWRLDDVVQAAASGIDEAGIVDLMTVSKVQALEVEFFRKWIGEYENQSYQEAERHLLSLAGRLGARHINTAVFEEQPIERVVSAFRDLCRRAAPYNLIVQLEFMPYTPPVDSLKTAWKIIEQVDEPNAGLLIDMWHWARTSGNEEQLKNIPPAVVTSIQVSDVLVSPLEDVRYESVHHRMIPGTGAFDIPACLQLLASHGVDAPLSVEVISDELDEMTPARASKEVILGTREILWQTMWQTFGNMSKHD